MGRLVPLRSALASAVIVAVLAFLAGSYSTPAPATAQTPIRWKVQSAWPPTSIVQDAAKLLVETIDKTSGGRLKIELSPAGVAVFGGMLGVTLFGVFLTPVFYDVIRRLEERRSTARPEAVYRANGDHAGE